MIKIKKWGKYQSYKDRKPPWIRFHRSMLDNYEYQLMTAESRALLPMLWLLACENEDPTSGIINLEIKVIAFRLRQDVKTVTSCISELQAVDFIECIESVTKPLQNSNETVPSETETETETDPEFESIWALYGKKGNRKTSLSKFKKLSKLNKKLLIEKLPLYVSATPIIKYRKGFESYLEKECWNDKIINENNQTEELFR